MKILSIMTVDPTATQPHGEDLERMGAFAEEMKAKGVLIDTGGVMPGSLEFKAVRKNGAFTVTDGPFTESKEVVGGFALLEVSGRDEAIEVTRRFLDLAGDATCQIHEVNLA
jgi:hypothetical protein